MFSKHRRRILLLMCGLVAAPGRATGGAAGSNETMEAFYMRRAIELANLAVSNGAQPYGALIADPATDTILAEGCNSATENPIWHGEMAAIQNLSSTGVNVYAVAPDLELYTTAEPCSMCMSAISWSGFGRVVFGTSIPFIEGQGAPQIDIRAVDVVAASTTLEHNITVVGGVLRNETDPLYVKCGERCRHGAAGDHDHGQDHGHDHSHDHDQGHR